MKVFSPENAYGVKQAQVIKNTEGSNEVIVSFPFRVGPTEIIESQADMFQKRVFSGPKLTFSAAKRVL